MPHPVLAKSGRGSAPVVVSTPDSGHETADDDILCPRCDWRPSSGSRWCCSCESTPEPPFDACGTVWNTFETRGRCPGCQHQWQWTTCLSCGVASLHEHWYRRRARPPAAGRQSG
jgi:hypothetical protein